MKHYLALDYGASSGRAILGTYDGGVLKLEEVHRFANGPVEKDGHLHWDSRRLFEELKTGLKKAVAMGCTPVSIAVDTWGVDFGLLDGQDQLLDEPFHYRDRRTVGMLDQVFSVVPREEVFRQTGNQFMELNTLFQLYAMKQGGDKNLARAKSLLFMPDLMNFWLTGRKTAERTIASTSQCYNPVQRTWAKPLLGALGLPAGLFQEIVEPGTVLGPIQAAVAKETGAVGTVVVTPGGHDTACAVASVPASRGTFAYLSSGTWSLLGIESPEPLVGEKSLAYNFTNECGVFNRIRFLKNITGLWIVQECRRTWNEQGRNYSFRDIERMAREAAPFAARIDPDAPDFGPPGDMPERIRAYCQRTGQTPPETPGGIIRTALESLVLKYRQTLDRIEEIAGHRFDTLHIVGGGTQDVLTSQFTANATGRRVIAGPVEATAIGNLMMQMVAMGDLDSLEAGREMVRRSFETSVYEPQDREAWEAACRARN